MSSTTPTTQSTFTWLAYSEREQRQAQDLASTLTEKETRDELGIGSIRDAIADRLFPGTSTIQSRARYFFFVPWIFQQLEREPPGNSRQRADTLERRLAATLRRAPDTAGLVGAQKLNVARLPSSIYWNGLGVLGIRRAPISLSEYYRWLDDPQRSSRIVLDDDGMPLAGEAASIWQSMPAPPEGYLDETEFALTRAEANYLLERAEAASPHRPTLLRHLFEYGRAADRADYPWLYPWTERRTRVLPAHVREEVEVAELFSLGHHGAALVFNLLIAEARDEEERQVDYRNRIRVWQVEAISRLATFELVRLWALVPSGPGTRRAHAFVERWFELIRHDGERPLSDNPTARKLVRERELRVKGPQRSRIANPRRVGWNGESGSGRLDFRWGTVQQLVLDVAQGRGRRA
jgi:hypothetical protein